MAAESTLPARDQPSGERQAFLLRWSPRPLRGAHPGAKEMRQAERVLLESSYGSVSQSLAGSHLRHQVLLQPWSWGLGRAAIQPSMPRATHASNL